MTDAEMTEAVESALGAVEDWDGFGGDARDNRAAKLGRALLESRRQVEALTNERDEARQMCRIQFIDEEGRRCVRFVDAAAVVAERDAATARAERAEQARLDAVAIASRLEAEDYRTMPKLHQRDRTVAATERARLVEAIAAYHDDEACQHDGVDAGPWDSGAYAAHKMSAEHVRSHNWAPPEEDVDE